MSDIKSTPKRALSTKFTEQTLRRSILAKKRNMRRRQVKELFLMKNTTFLRIPVGALVAVAIVIAGGVGAYAAMNWFNGDVKVGSDNSVMGVDLSQCESTTIPGVDIKDPKNVQFKITGEPHISTDELKEHLIAQCEFNAVRTKYPNEAFSVQSSLIKNITPYTVTLESFWNGKFTDKTFSINVDTSFYDKGVSATINDLKAGDTVVYAYNGSASATENVNSMDSVVAIASIFKTQYDTKKVLDGAGKGSSVKGFYEQNNILPLDTYNSLKH